MARRLRQSTKGGRRGWEHGHVVVCWVSPTCLCARRFPKMFDPMSRSGAGGGFFLNLWPAVGEIALRSEEKMLDTHAHAHLLSTPVQLCGDHQAGSPEGRNRQTHQISFRVIVKKMHVAACMCARLCFYIYHTYLEWPCIPQFEVCGWACAACNLSSMNDNRGTLSLWTMRR